ncbi:MAG: EAL domain-containing protein [Clostridia bacterium]|nr:EAL domain-containing protein [Clostridia bacterium]
MNPSFANPILILRTEIVCLILLAYLIFVSRTFRMGKEGRIFNLIMTFGMIHVVMDAVTVWTVNHPESIPPWLNDTVHLVFYLSAILFSTEILLYMTDLCYPKNLKTIRIVADSLVAAYLIAILTGLLKIEYGQFDGTRASIGSAPAAGFALCFLFFLVCIAMILQNRRHVGKHLQMLLVPMLFLLLAMEIVQILVKEFLFTGATLTVITVGFFFSLENPTAVLEKKIMMDALSGLGSRSSYEHDMEQYDAEFLRDRTIPFTFVFIDINNLRSINGLYGHEEGDAYIGKVAALLVANLHQAEHIYRMGGDEFLAIFRKTEEKAVVRDIQRVHDACDREDEKGTWGKYRPELAIGYAVSDTKYNNLRDVLRVADYMMYRNKTALKREVAVGTVHENGTRLNLYGLTDRVFDAMCLTSVEFYPYMTNLETGVTRIAPAMEEFFGLGSEFIQDFLSVWMDRVHPADRDGYERDIRATLKGLQDYHFYRYRARAKDGTYVDMTCRGGLYHGRDGEPDIFSGYIVNHGAPQTRDSVTSLMNERALRERMEKDIPAGTEMILMRMEIRNLNRAKMLYGTEALNSVLRSTADICLHAVKDHGEVYSEGARNFIFVLPGNDRSVAEEVFGKVREACAGGVMGGNRVIPLNVYAGALELPDPNLKDTDQIRSAMQYISEEAGFEQGGSKVLFRRTAGGTGEEDATLLRTVHHDCLTDRSHFFLRLQPIIDAASEKVAGAEALLRYKSPAYGEVPPGRFISFLESDAGYTELGYDILRMALQHAGKIRQTLPEFNINVNITALQLYADDFIPRVKHILEEENYPADHLILELTERCKEMEFDILKQRVNDLREAGFRVALDDMGTGFSTIDLLLHLNVNEIKLDMQFTQHMRENENDPKFAELLVALAEENDMLLCFEGVETEEQRDYLKRFGRVLFQGYYYDRPLRIEEFTAKYCE